MKKRIFDLYTSISTIIPVSIAAVVYAGLVIAVTAIPGTANAQTVCSTYPQIKKELSSKFAEAPIGVGLSKNGTVIQVFSAADGTTWTIVSTDINGQSCLIANGEAWQNLPVNPRGPRV